MLDTAQPKGRKRATVKRAKDRVETTIIKQVRAACVDRDGRCRLNTESDVSIAALWALLKTGGCRDWSEWAHLEGSRRFETRGQAPEVRHTTHGSLMLCKRHHDMYDGRHQVRLTITPLTDRGADGPLEFRRQA